MVLEKTLESPLYSKEVKPINPTGNQPSIGRTDAEVEGPILWAPDAEPTHWKRLMLGKIEGRRRRGQHRMRWLDGITEFNGQELRQTRRDSEGQGSLAYCSPWGRKESDTT